MIDGFWTSIFILLQGFYIFVGTWPVSVVLLAFIAVAFQATRVKPTWYHASESLILLVFPFGIIVTGGFCWHSGTVASAPIIPNLFVGFLLCLQVICCLALIYVRKDFRLLTASISLVVVWITLIYWFIAGMALTNSWL
ncbi:MAG: hypothetical protein WBC19_15125 [Pyrinomonadaceae bacterium]